MEVCIASMQANSFSGSYCSISQVDQDYVVFLEFLEIDTLQ